MGDAPPARALPKLTFKLKRPVSERADDERARTVEAEDGRARKRAREDANARDEDARIEELKREMARLREALERGGAEVTGGVGAGARAGGAHAGGGGGRMGLNRGVAPRAMVFDRFGDVRAMGGGREEDTPSSSALGGQEEEEDVAGGVDVGGSRVTLDPPRVKNEAPMSRRKFEDVLNKLQKLDKMFVFAYPVTEDIAPGYFSVISKPMDFSTLRANLKNNHYLTAHSFCVDVETMFRNALKYNPPATEIHQLAESMLEQARKMLNKMRGLSANAGIVKPSKNKTIVSTSSVSKMTKMASVSALAGVSSEVDMFTSGASQHFANDDNSMHYVNDENDFDLGLDSFLDDSFPMMGMDFHGVEAFGLHHVDVNARITVSNVPQKMLPKTIAASKRQTFKVPIASQHIARLPEIFPGMGGPLTGFRAPLQRAGNLFTSSQGSATLDMYSASVRAFLSAVDETEWDTFLTAKWKASVSVPDPVMVEVPKISTPVPAVAGQFARLPSSSSNPVLPTSSSTHQSPYHDSVSLATLLRENPDDPNYPARVKAGIAGMRALRRAGDVLRGDEFPENENPLDSLPLGVIPLGKSMVFTVTVIANTIAHSMKRQLNIELPLPKAPSLAP